jgi:hypothetical protein
MNDKKSIFLQILVILWISVSFWYSLVFAWISGKVEWKSSDNIFIDDASLRSSKVYISASDDISDATISGDCSVKWKFLESLDKLFVFQVDFLEKCNDNKAIVHFEKSNFQLTTMFNIISNLNLYSQYLDYSDEKLEWYLNEIELSKKAFEKYSGDYNKSIHISYKDYLENSRKLKEINTLYDFIKDILTKREQKYLIPVKWVSMPTKSNRLPNTGRPYRASYTDWVHGWWDFYADFWDTIQSLDYWVIVRVVKGFKYSDIWQVKETWELTDLDKLWNLDILRWNQVWVKTMKWDVAFYAHLNEVFDDIKEWDIVFKWQPLWTIWISWVPDQDYKDYHLHLEVHKNPYLQFHKNSYTFEDYLAWDWYFKWQSEKYILDNQNDLFQENK